MEKKRLVTRKDAAASLSISVDTLDRLTRKHILPCKYIGARRYYRPEDLDSFAGRKEIV